MIKTTKTEIGSQTIDGTNHIRIFHSRVLLSNKKIPILSRKPTEIEITNWLYITKQEEMHASYERTARAVHVTGEEEDEQELIEESVHPVIKAIRDIPGVEYAVGASYQLIVIKGRMFEWEEITKSILCLLTSFSLEDLESIKFEEPNAGTDSTQENPSTDGPVSE